MDHDHLAVNLICKEVDRLPVAWWGQVAALIPLLPKSSSRSMNWL
jgi:hypothetical protein